MQATMERVGTSNLFDEALHKARELDAGLVDLPNVMAQNIEVSEGVFVINPDTEDEMVAQINQPAMRQLLDRLELNITGGKTQLARFFTTNLGMTQTANDLNSYLHTFNNRNTTFNLRVQDGVIIGALDPRRDMSTRTQILEPFALQLQRDNVLTENSRIVNTNFDNGNVVMRIVARDINTQLDSHGVGIELFHNLIGNGKTQINPLVKTTSCDNSLVSSNTGIGVNTVGNFFPRYNAAIRGMSALVNGAVETVEQMESLSSIALPFESFLEFLRSRSIRLSDPQIELMLEGTRDQENNLYGQVNGLTYFAHRWEDVSFEDRMNLEYTAGRIVNEPAWVLDNI